jgi:hypothetical protein
MKGEMDRECRASGGVVKDDRRQVKKAFKSPKPTGMAPDATLKRGKGPLFRKRGGKVAERKEDGEYAAGGAVAARKRGGAVDGKGKKPHMGRAGRASGGGVGSDLRPLTSADKPRKPKDRKIMPESEATP